MQEGIVDRVRNTIRCHPDLVGLIAVVLLAGTVTWFWISVWYDRNDQGRIIVQLQAESSRYATELVTQRQATTEAYNRGLRDGHRQGSLITINEVPTQSSITTPLTLVVNFNDETTSFDMKDGNVTSWKTHKWHAGATLGP